MTKTIKNKIIKIVQDKIDEKKEQTKCQRDALDSIIKGELQKWVALQSYWNIKLDHLVNEFNYNRGMTVESKLLLLQEFDTHSKEPYKWRYLKERVQETYISIMDGSLNETEEILIDYSGEDKIVLDPTRRVLKYIPDKVDTSPEVYTRSITFDDLYAGVVR